MDSRLLFKTLVIGVLLIVGAIVVAPRISLLTHSSDEKGNAASLSPQSAAGGNAVPTAAATVQPTIIPEESESSLAVQFPLLEEKSTRPGVRGLIAHGSRTIHEIALTFDACEVETAGYDARVVEELVKAHVPATLFLGGKWMLDHRAATRDLARVPFLELANHSYNHPHFMRLSVAQIRDQVIMTQNILYDLTGRRALLFRFPYGEWSSAAIPEIDGLGLRMVQWDVVSGDPSPEQTASLLIATVLRQAQNGSIVVMHMNGFGWHTAEALPSIISGLRSRGYSLVTASQLLADSLAAAETPGDDSSAPDSTFLSGSFLEAE